MKQGKRKIFLTAHFKRRWRERIGEDTDGQMQRSLHAALLEKVAKGYRHHYFTVDIRSRRAVFRIDGTGCHVFLTVLEAGMKMREERDEHTRSESQSGRR